MPYILTPYAMCVGVLYDLQTGSVLLLISFKKYETQLCNVRWLFNLLCKYNNYLFNTVIVFRVIKKCRVSEKCETVKK